MYSYHHKDQNFQEKKKKKKEKETFVVNPREDSETNPAGKDHHQHDPKQSGPEQTPFSVSPKPTLAFSPSPSALAANPARKRRRAWKRERERERERERNSERAGSRRRGTWSPEKIFIRARGVCYDRRLRLKAIHSLLNGGKAASDGKHNLPLLPNCMRALSCVNFK